MDRNPRPVEVSSDELLDAILAFGVEVLELMHGRELLHVQTVGSDDVWVRGKGGREGMFISATFQKTSQTLGRLQNI